jgi:hypothetical protein
MAKKKRNPLDDFKLTFDGLNNGIEIPISNSLRSVKKEIPNTRDSNAGRIQGSNPAGVTDKLNKNKVVIPSFDFTDKKVETMVNVVPTSGNKKKKESKLDVDFNLERYSVLTKTEKIVFLAKEGWSLKVERRRNTFYHYATKYIERKKKRIYLGSINKD